MEGIGGGLNPAVEGQIPGERREGEFSKSLNEPPVVAALHASFTSAELQNEKLSFFTQH